MKPIHKLLTAAVVATSLTACTDDGVDASIIQVLERDGYSSLLVALRTTGLDAVLRDRSRDFTVFAPTNEAFETLGDISGLSTEQLTDVLLYHVIADAEIESPDAIAAAGTTITAANTDELGVALQGMDLFINQSQVVEADIETGNGVIHAIDAVLLPTTDEASSGNIATVAASDSLGRFDTLVSALVRVGLDTVVSDPDGKFTVFAPTDDAFTALGINLGTLTDEQLTDILLYHVVSGKEINASAATAIAGNKVEMANTEELSLSLTGSELFANLSSIVVPNVDASNGIIHAIDTVMLPPSPTDLTGVGTIADIVVAADGTGGLPALTTLEAAVLDRGLEVALSGPGPFTVFAPTDAAFADLPPGTVAGLLGPDTLSEILLKHVVDGSVDSVTAFTLNGLEVMTLNPNGEVVEIEIDSNEFTVDGAVVSTFEIQATNGVVHVIDSVILLD